MREPGFHPRTNPYTSGAAGARELASFIASKNAAAAGPGPGFDPAALEAADQFAPYFRTGTRIKVTTTHPDGETYVRTGTVGVTSGWRPVFLLMHRSSDHGSSDVLRASDRITGIQTGRHGYRRLVTS